VRIYETNKELIKKYKNKLNYIAIL
jgi:hypothetical protein